MEEPGLQQGPGREENLLRVLEETALGLRDLLTARDHQEGRVGKRRRVSQGEEDKLREKLVHFRNEGEQISQSERVKENERGMEGGMVTHEEVWKEKEREAKYKLLRLLREFGELHTQRSALTQSYGSLLTGRSADDQANIANACFVRAPGDVARVMTCEVADALSSLMVIGSEELVSRVLRVKVQDGTRCPFPVTVAMPFRARYHGNYRDFMVKVVDGEKRASYISPVSTQGIYGGQMGSFAEVRLYSLGLLAVVSCLRRENYTVPRRGLSLKLSMDPRACLDYLPGSFTAPVVAQSMLQPVDATLLATLKSRSDAYHEVLSTSPLLYLTHPSSQGLRRPLTLTLPCPTNPDKRRVGQGEEPDQCARPISAVPSRDMPTLHRVRAVSASVKFSRELSNGLLVLLGWRDEQWNVLDQVIVRNLQNGLVSFELTENFERLVVVRLLSSMRPSYLTTLVEEVEDSVQRTMVSIVLQRRREKPHMALVAALPSRDLSWELSILRAQGYCGPPEPSLEIPMCEGEQLLLSFNGNITSTGSQSNQNDGRGVCEQITFHSQRKNRLHLCLTEVDPFGNYSSPHYKGMAVFHKITRDQLEWREGKAVLSNSGSLKDPVCKLSLTLPKKVRPISRHVSAKVITHDQSEPLSDSTLRWLSEELSEENLALMVLSFRLRRSSIQLVRLQAPDSLAAQAYHVLGLWRRALPAAPHPAKAAQLARCLTKSGRPDLAKELLLRQAATRGTPEEPEE
ncbi:death domain-containing protein 1 [Coregonus clupeaformis]|uniref:death domain-containing protein 1 n=1 Tax=Coregonus clupeaformis TaxID=59861 RepID=UPI001E1C5E06|nr:death domain-containing protein 1 [Coregonus clupeaformis]